MKKLFTFLFALATLFSAKAQVLDEGFEAGSLPTDWSQFYIDKTHDWEYQSEGVKGNLSDSHTGTCSFKYWYRNTYNRFCR